MAREPELSIKVKVDPQIKPTELKTSIERKVKQSGEKPQIDIDPNVDGIKKKVEDKLKNIKATASITPVVDTEKLKTDIQQQINGIGDIPKVTVGVNVDDFSSELTKQLKDQLKEVNQQLSYYLKNLTSNTDRLGSFANDIFSTKDLKASAKQVANEVSDEFVGGLSGTFNINDLLNYKISDTTKKRNLSQVENLVNEIKDIWAGLYADNWLDDDKININAFNDQFTQLGSKAKELKSILDSVYSAFDSDKFKDKLDVFNAQGFDLNKKLKEFMSIDDFLDEIIDKSKDAFKTTDQAMDFSKLINGLTGDNKISFNSVLDNVSGELGNVHAKISEINSSAKAVKTEIKDVQKEANAAQKTDTSGHLDASTIETYGQKLDKVLSNIADKQNAINDARKTAVNLEKSILAATVLTREGLSNELTQYEALFKKFDTDKIAKFAETTNLAEFIKNQEIKMQDAQNSGEKNQIEDGVYNVKKVKFDIDPAVLQANIDAVFENITAPIRLSLAPGTVDNLINEITPKLDNIQININNNNSNNGVHFKDWEEAVDALLHDGIDDTMRDVGMGVLKALELDADHSKALKKLKETYGFDKIIKDTDAGITAYWLDNETGYDDLVEEASKWYNNYIAQIQKSKPIDVKGKVTITDADVVVDVKNPVAIPGTVTVNPTSVQFGNSDDLQKNASALSSVKQSLNKISTGTEDYGTKIATIGPSVQYVTQEVDNLSKSLENQITDLDLIAKKTDAYGTTANSITLNTKDVATPTAPVDIPGKVTLKVEDVTPPKDSVKIPGKVELEVSDITPPKTAVELEGKVSNVTVDNSAKGKKKNVKDDVKKPEVIDLKGRVELKDEDIKRPNPLNLNGAVKIKAADVKIDDVEISKKEFDIAGNLILKNAKIVDAVKEAAGKKSEKKGTTKSKIDSNIIDVKAQQEANRLLQQEEQLQQKIADAAQKKADAENRSFNRDVVAAQKKYDQAELDNLKAIESIYRELTSLESKRGRYTKPEQAFDLHQIEDQISADEVELNEKMLSASEVGYNPLKVTSIRKQALKYYYAQASSDNKFDIAKQQAAIKIQQEATKALQEETEAKEKAAEATKKQEEAENKLLARDIIAQEKKDNSDGSKAIDDIVSSYQKIISLQKQRTRFVDAKDKEDLDEVNKQLAEEETRLSELMFNFQDSTGVNPYQFADVRSIADLAEKEYRSSNRIVENKRNDQYQNLVNQLSGAQKTYGTVEEAAADDKAATDIQVALQKQQELVSQIAKAKVGTEEYNNAIQTAEENWKSVVAIIDTVEKKQKDLTKAVDSIEKKFYQLAEEVSGSSNEKLKNSINGVITKAATLSVQNPNTYENYAVDYNELKRESYKANAQYTIWKSNYKKLEREGIKIAEGVEVARQMQADGSLQNVKFDGIDNLLKQLNELEPQTDAYKEKLVEVKKIWEEIERKVKAVEESEKQAAKRESTKAGNLTSIGNAISQNRATMKDVQKNYGTDYSFYGKLQEKDSKLKTLLDTVTESSDPVSGAKEWAKNNLDISPDKINSVTDAINQLNIAYREATQEAKDFNKEASREKSINKASMEVANLKATIHDYIAEHKKLEGTDVGKSLYELLEALNQSDAPEKIGELKKKYAELRAESKKLGLESRNLLDVFEKLFGQHLSTMITMAALHKMQDALRIVYQNVVEIDTAVTELRKVSEYTGKSLEEYMGRAAEQAQKLGVSISDYVNSTADWKRLGYSDEDAENLATYSTLLRNVGDNIDDVNTSSSYLISTLQGFGLLADQAEDVVNKIDAVANTQPVTAKDLGEILTRSSAAMSAANNTLEETIALGTAANAVIQDADTVGTTLKSLSMYLRAAKSDAENAGIEVDGMANSVSELRSELKSLTGVDIMLDSKNFKSTYQIMKELSQVWSGLSDVTQANVTEMIGGKRNANAVSAILNNFDVAESAMESAANSANVAWEENEKWLDSIQGRLGQLDASFQVLSTDVLSSGLVKGGVSFLTSIVKLLDKIINLTGALPAGLGIAAFATQLGKPKMTGFMIVPSNTPGGDTEQVLRRYFIISLRSMREYLVKPTNMVA
jgi:TP901 family phage tail tape measure protein